MRLKWSDFITIENLNTIAINLAKGSKNKYRMDILDFYTYYGQNIISLYKDLCNNEYKHGSYNFFSFKNNKNKVRTIYYSNFRDMIVERLLSNYLLYLYNDTFIEDTYSGLVNRGIISMVKRVLYFQKEAYENFNNPMLIKLDVNKYFDTINKDIVFDIIKNKTNDVLFLNTFKESLYSQTDVPGLCFGNLTSSTVGNIYLNEFDHYIKEKLKIDFMCRYMDDIVLIVDKPRNECRYLYHNLNKYLLDTRNIKFNVNKVLIRDIYKIPLLGYVLKIVNGRQITKIVSRNKSKYLKLVKSCCHNKIERLNSWWGYANIADCNYMIYRSLIRNNDIKFNGKFEYNNDSISMNKKQIKKLAIKQQKE